MNQYLEWIINKIVLGNPKISQDVMKEIDRIIRIYWIMNLIKRIISIESYHNMVK